MLLALENMLVYRPRKHTEDWRPVPNERVRDLFLTLTQGVKVHAWWCPTPDWRPADGAMLYCHGNAGNLSHRGEGVARWQRELNQAVLIFDYPGYGKSEGKPTEAGCYAAADAAYEWLTREQQVSPERVLLYGGSLGGGVAVDLASRRPHRALLLLATFNTMPSVAQRLYPYLPVRWVMRNRFDSERKIRGCTQPVFLAHGDRDRLIPLELGQRLFAAANEPKTFFLLRGCDHHDPPGEDFWVALRAFLNAAAPLPAAGLERGSEPPAGRAGSPG